jgi:hypothetical protein
MRRTLINRVNGAAGRATVPARSRYALRRGLGVWELTFEGNQAVLKHERGVLYVAWLLINRPPEPIHALDLNLRVREMERTFSGISGVVDPASGKAVLLEKNARIQERSAGLSDAETLRILREKESELEAILEDEDESEPVKAEAMRELEAIAKYRQQQDRRGTDSAQKAARAVRMAITRFQKRLAVAVDTGGNPHPVLGPFAAHLRQHLLIPSARYSGLHRGRARGSLAGCFTYEPPAGVSWNG